MSIYCKMLHSWPGICIIISKGLIYNNWYVIMYLKYISTTSKYDMIQMARKKPTFITILQHNWYKCVSGVQHPKLLHSWHDYVMSPVVFTFNTRHAHVFPLHSSNHSTKVNFILASWNLICCTPDIFVALLTYCKCQLETDNIMKYFTKLYGIWTSI